MARAMTTFALVVLTWLAFTFVLFAPHGRMLRALWREPVLACPVVIVESDDWGPGPASDALILRRIAAQLADIRDRDGRPALMTLGVVLGKPDGAAILADDCQRYHRRLLDEEMYAPIVEAMREGCAKGVFALQRHGLEHCWPGSLIDRARHDDIRLDGAGLVGPGHRAAGAARARVTGAVARAGIGSSRRHRRK